MQGCDTPATRRQKASCSAKPPSQPARCALVVRRVTYKTGAGPVGANKLAQHGPSGDSSAKKFSQHA